MPTRATTTASRSSTSGNPSNPPVVAQIPCPGSQNDVTVNDGILVTSTDSLMTDNRCNANVAVPDASDTPGAWEGLQVFDCPTRRTRAT